MQLSSHLLTGLKSLPQFILASLVIFFCLSSFNASAANQNTAFIPFKINAPNLEEMTLLSDKALQEELATKNFTMLPRNEAQNLVDYSGSWPPPPEVLAKIVEQTGFDYIAIGTLTEIAGQLSADIQVFDILTPGSAHSSYQSGIPTTELTTIMQKTVNDILSYTSRNFLVATISPQGNNKIDSGALLRKISTKPGDIYDPVQLRSDLKAIFSMGYFDNVEIESRDTEKGKEVIFRVQEKPVIQSVIITGTDELDEQEIRDAGGITPNSILNPTRLNEAVQRINELYKSKGYYNTKTTANISYPSENKAEVTFSIVEGEKIFIGDILFEGNESFDDDDLENIIETKNWNWLSWITETGVLKMDLLNQDAARLGAFYNNNGFVEVKVEDPIVEQKEDELFITFRIEEGPRYRVGTVEVSGDLIQDSEQLLSKLTIRDEEFLNRQALRTDSSMLTDIYAEQGYAFADIRPRINKAAESQRVDILFEINQGPLVYFNRVEIEGNTRTRDNVIRRDLVVKEGGLFNSTAIRQSTEYLNRLGFFEEVSVIPQPTLLEDQMDVEVSVKEKSTGQFSIGAGYSSSDKLMFMSEISEDNLMGTGNRLSLAANVSSVTTQFNLSFTNPRILDSKVLAGTNIFNWSKEYDDYTKDSTGAGVNLGHSLIEKWRINYGYSYTDTDLSDIAPNASIVIRLSEDINITSAARVSLGRDTRNSLYNASSGSVNTVSVEYAGGILGGDAAFTKVEGSSSWFFQLPFNCVFHIKGAAGQAFENDPLGLPVYERFYLGGLNSIRGFESSYVSPTDPITGERIGGDKMWYGNLEIIFPLFEEMGLRGVVFTDLGNVYGVHEDWDFSSIRNSAGIGFRWLSPVGPLRLEWGYNLDPQKDEDSSVWDFSIGGAF